MGLSAASCPSLRPTARKTSTPTCHNFVNLCTGESNYKFVGKFRFCVRVGKKMVTYMV
jgi:hypothetical protein